MKNLYQKWAEFKVLYGVKRHDDFRSSFPSSHKSKKVTQTQKFFCNEQPAIWPKSSKTGGERFKRSRTKEQKRQLLFVLRIFICILSAGLSLFGYIEKQNELTELRLAIPLIAKEVKNLQEQNIRLMYEIERFESPIHLMELMHKPEFGHLKYPFLVDEIFLPQGEGLSERQEELLLNPREGI